MTDWDCVHVCSEFVYMCVLKVEVPCDDKSKHTTHTTHTQLPKEIGQLRSLSILDISHNDIRQLPDEMGHLDHLFLLNLQGLDKLPLDPTLLRGPTKNITAFLKSRRIKVRSLKILNIYSL